jgi:hypothetical protein
LTTTNATPEPVTVTLNGNTNTLVIGSSLLNDGNNCNVGFLMLVPTGTALNLTASYSAGNITISVPTVVGQSYQVVSKSTLNAAAWVAVPGSPPVSGNGSVESVQYAIPATPGAVFYAVEVVQ